ncbi:hypothetical protein AMJ83_06435 [candidate division WOR_3 bacterium SM23_42]|uniref:Uncharacterized protein n=1 Tax=candidate division WOR_3 bacterium SM23_42 TaxID=1703779 RepID=A0A0S8FUC7_UNCW3|nr:MAG: hypothetical protein AMJ83_06435 [candidate division WOR_3 bacterium SM23_42]
MDIIEKLKKERKVRSVFDVIKKGREAKQPVEERPDDIEVRELNPAQPSVAGEQSRDDADATEEKEVREFRTEGMHEFDIDSLGVSGDGAVRIEYKSKIGKLIDAGKFDEAIELLEDLKSRQATTE